MADNIIGNMFGVDPDQLAQQRQQQIYAQSIQQAQLNPYQRASASLYQGGAGVGQIGAQMMGWKAPGQQLAENRKAALAGLDTNDPDSVTKAAQALNASGDTQGASMLAQHAQDLIAQKSALNAQQASTEYTKGRTVQLGTETLGAEVPVGFTPDGKRVYHQTGSDEGQYTYDDKGKRVIYSDKVVTGGQQGGKTTAAGDFLLKNPDTVNWIADQVLAGDSKAAQGYGRSADAKAIIAKAIMDRGTAAGMTPQQLTNITSEYGGFTAGNRALGTQSAKITTAAIEAKNIIKLAQQTVDTINPTDYPAMNNIQNIFNSQSGDPKIVRLKNNLNALVNTYARAISPSGTPTVSDKEHAREVISEKYGKLQFPAAFDAINQEMDQAIAAPKEARKSLAATRISELPTSNNTTKKVVKWGDLP